jgi:hypothetical protein
LWAFLFQANAQMFISPNSYVYSENVPVYRKELGWVAVFYRMKTFGWLCFVPVQISFMIRRPAAKVVGVFVGCLPNNLP